MAGRHTPSRTPLASRCTASIEATSTDIVPIPKDPKMNDTPMPEANELTVHIMAAVAQAERKAIASRTRDALQAAKARGQRLGNPNGAAALRRAGKGNGAAVATIKAGADAFATDLAPIVERLRAEGATSLPKLALGLNEGGFETARGGRWHPSSVRNLLSRICVLSH